MRLSVATLLVLFSTVLSGQGIEFFHGSWEEALVAAREQDKLIFVDAYASWCGPCKRMSQNVIPLEDVGNVYNNSFISVKMDMEKPESVDFRQSHSVSAYPTLIFVNAENEEVHKSVGGKSGPQLIQLASEAMARMDDLPTYEAQYEAGDRDPDFVYKYVRALVRQGQPHLRVANDYLRAERDALQEPRNLRMILMAATHVDSRIFDMLVDNQTDIIAAHSREVFEAQVLQAARNTRDRAVEFGDEDLLEEAIDKLKRVLPQEAEAFGLEGEFRLAGAGTDSRAYFKAARDFHKKVASSDVAQLRWLYSQLTTSNFLTDSKVLDLTEEVGWEFAEPSEDFTHLYRFAEFLHKQGRTPSAIRAAELCMEKIPEEDVNRRRAVGALIQRIEQAN